MHSDVYPSAVINSERKYVFVSVSLLQTYAGTKPM